MSYYRICSYCGANLDPGERCDCRDEKAAADATNIDDGKAEQVTTAVSASDDTRKNAVLQGGI